MVTEERANSSRPNWRALMIRWGSKSKCSDKGQPLVHFLHW